MSKNPDVSLLMGKIYLYSCLTSQNFNLVAEQNGYPVGIIMGYINKKPNADILKYQQRLENYCNEMLQYPEGKFILELFAGFETLDKEMLLETGKNYDGELAFFVTSSKVRGLHIGTILYRNLYEEFLKYNCKNIFVYTDVSCNFGFYEHQGFIKVNHRIHLIHDHQMEFYIYEKELR